MQPDSFWREVINHIPNIVLVTDVECRILDINQSGLAIVGLKREEIVGQDCRKIFCKENPDFYRCRYDELLQQKKPVRFELSGNGITGKVFLVDLIPVFAQGETLETVIHVFYDLSEKKEFEALMIEKNKELQRISQLKSDFTSTISHELRTPLAAMQEGVRLVVAGLAGPLTEDQKKFLGIVRNNLDRLSRLINDLLDIEKMDGTRFHFKTDMHNNDLVSVIRECVSVMAMEAKNWNINLTAELPEEQMNLYCDKDRIQQLFINLMSNAIRYNRDGGSVKVSIQKKNQSAVICVEDTGIGIKDEYKDKIFEKFFQVVEGVPRRPGGTGLGLAVCQSIVELHQGKIWLESTHGKGSKFFVEFHVS